MGSLAINPDTRAEAYQVKATEVVSTLTGTETGRLTT